MKLALDTNVIVYSVGLNGAAHQRDALSLLHRIPREAIIVPVQALGELFNVLVRKGGSSRAEAAAVVDAWRGSVSVVPTSDKVMGEAIALARDHGLSIWDAVILSAAAEGGCRLLLSEDMQDGFSWSGVTVVNPFATEPHPLLAGLLTEDR